MNLMERAERARTIAKRWWWAMLVTYVLCFLGIIAILFTGSDDWAVVVIAGGVVGVICLVLNLLYEEEARKRQIEWDTTGGKYF